MVQLFILLMGLLATALSGAEGRLVEQSPPYVMVTPGVSQSVTCTLKDTAYPWMSWYLQDAHGLLHFLVQSGTKGDQEEILWMGTSYRYERVSNLELRLEMKNVTKSETIYCTCSKGGGGSTVYFGEGTRLTVLEDGLNSTTPSVVIFPPSKQEIKEKGKATLVCLATDYYPDHINVVWRVNGEERKDGVSTDESLRDEKSKKYSLTSRLRISAQEWFNPKNKFQCSVEFHGNETEKFEPVLDGEAGCSVTEESYLRSAKAGQSVYVLLICKSVLYGVFVMWLMLRNKQVY